MAWKGLVDSPPDQSETLRRLREIEAALGVCRDGGDWELALRADHDAILRELWELLLDVVCSPLWLRIRAAELLNVCFTLHSEYLRIEQAQAWRLRSIVSSTCQILDEFDPRAQAQATELFHWMAFLEHLLFATRDAQVFRQAVFRHATYASLLAKMVKLLGKSSTQLFAATTICLAAFHRHEIHASETTTADTATDPQRHSSVLLDVVLRDEAGREGIEHLGGALLHVINSCGYPCPEHRRSPLEDSIQLLIDILLHDKVSHVLYLNDFKVLVDIVLRECTDLPLEDGLRGAYLTLLDVALASPLYLETQLYRKAELLRMLQELLEAGTSEDSQTPREITVLVGRVLLARIDRLD